MNESINKMNIKKISFLIFLITFAAYFNTLNGFFISDDYAFLTFLKDGRLKDLIYADLPLKGGFFVRPLGNLWWWFDYSIWRFNPIGYHINNTSIHALSSILVALIAFSVFKDRKISFFSGVLFSLHPVHAEAVTWLSIRYDLLCAFFYLLTLYTFNLYISQRHKRYVYLVSIIAYPLALLSKEMAITLPLILILYDFIATNKLKFKLYLPYILITFIYLIWRIAIIGDIGGYRDPSGQPLFFRELGIEILLKGIGYHLPFDLLFPFNKDIFKFSHYIILIILMTIIILSAISRKDSPFKGKIIIFSSGWILISVMPVYNMLCVGSNLFGSRILYLPSVGFCIFLAYIIGRNLSLQVIAGLFYAFILLVNNSAWNTAAAIAGEVPRIVKNFYQHNELAKLKLYFYLPDVIKGVWGPLGNGGIEGAVSPLFAPLTTDNVIVFSDVNLGSNFGYTYNDVDLRSAEFLTGSGEWVFFFRYNEKNNKVEDVTAKIKTSLRNKPPRIPVLNWDFHSESILKDWKIYNLSDKFVALNDDPYLVSPPLKIPAITLGFIEVKMRLESKEGSSVSPCEIWWISNKDKTYNHRKRMAFPVELDGQFHVYRAAFHIYNPDWLEPDVQITEIDFHPASCLSKIDIEYIRFIPYGD